MTTTIRQRAIESILFALLCLFLFFTAGLKVPVFDTTADNYFRQAISKAGAAYATCRIINASVSIIKESSLQLEPAGVGVSIAIGQALDPVDDMTERLSDLLITAIASLGVQQLVYQISLGLAGPVLSVLALLLALVVWIRNERGIPFYNLLLRCLIFVMAARLCLPVSALASGYIETHFIDSEITTAHQELRLGIADLGSLADANLPEVDGLIGTIDNSAALLKKKAGEFKTALSVLNHNMANIIENLLKLLLLYAGIFLIQVLLLPLLSFWVLSQIAGGIFLGGRSTTLAQTRLAIGTK